MNHKFKNGAELFRAIINNPQILITLPTQYRYDVDFLEPFYIILNEEIKPYIPYEIFEQLQNEALMNEYHRSYEQEQKNWEKEENQKKLNKSKK